MSNKEDKLIELVASHKYISLSDVLANLKILKKEINDIRVEYFLTRISKEIPWPAPYEAGKEINGKNYHCCSYSSIEDDSFPEDTKQLNVYMTEE